jgi:hypothetical protein
MSVTSNISRSIDLSKDAAYKQENECSQLAPPQITPTLNLETSLMSMSLILGTSCAVH